jgi:peptidoglycan/xylan/chitin deacetylase (PgdA/CDA1 family)
LRPSQHRLITGAFARPWPVDAFHHCLAVFFSLVLQPGSSAWFFSPPSAHHPHTGQVPTPKNDSAKETSASVCEAPSDDSKHPPEEMATPTTSRSRKINRREFLASAAALPIVAAAKSNSIPTVPPKAAPTTHGEGQSAAGVGAAGVGAAKLGRAAFVQHGPSTAKQFALTFHGAGDVALSETVLAITRKLRAPITVFAVGSWAASNPAVMKSFIDGGHELANHTFTHPSLRRLNRANVATEISGCAEALRHITGNIGGWFRPSGTPTPTNLMLEEALKVGYKTVVGYSVDPLDYQDPGTKAVVSRTLSNLQNGSIVSLHLGHKGTVEALEQIITGGRALGLQPVTVTALLSA